MSLNVHAITGTIGLDPLPATQAEQAVTDGAVKMKANVEAANFGMVNAVDASWMKVKTKIEAGNVAAFQKVKAFGQAQAQEFRGFTDKGLGERMTLDPGGEVGAKLLQSRAKYRELWDANFGAAGEAARRAGSAGGNGFLDGLKGALGRGSAAGILVKAMAGGGAIMAVGMAARELGAVGDMVGGVSEKLRLGEITTREAYDTFAYGIPVLGNVAKFFGGIGEAATGAEAALKAAAAQQKAWTDQAERMAKADVDQSKQSGEYIEKAKERGAARAREAALAAMPEGRAKDRAGRLGQWDDKAAAEARDRDDALKGAGADDDALAKLRGEVKYGHGVEARTAEVLLQNALDRREKIFATYGQNMQTENKSLHDDLAKIDKDAAAKKLKDQGEADKEFQAQVKAGLEETAAREADQAKTDAERRDKIQAEYKRLAAEEHKPEMRRLPVGALQMGKDAEQLFGPRTVTAADLPPGYAETRDSQKRTADNTTKMNELLAQLVDLWKQGNPSGAVPTIDVLENGGW